jgi:hypothetical protein
MRDQPILKLGRRGIERELSILLRTALAIVIDKPSVQKTVIRPVVRISRNAVASFV